MQGPAARQPHLTSVPILGGPGSSQPSRESGYQPLLGPLCRLARLCLVVVLWKIIPVDLEVQGLLNESSKACGRFMQSSGYAT